MVEAGLSGEKSCVKHNCPRRKVDELEVRKREKLTHIQKKRVMLKGYKAM